MSSSSPEQSLTPTNLRVPGHNISATSITSTHSEGACIAESRIASALSPHQRASIGSSTSSPSSPQLPSRGSSGKLQRGVKKLLRLPQTPNTVHHHPTLHEDPVEHSVSSKEALFVRMLKGSRRIRGFRRSKRRGIDKPYHSDDGYTSDPGPPGEEEEEETDGDVDENRRQQQIRNFERKIEKLRSSLYEDDEVHGSEQDLATLPGIDEDKHNDEKPHKPRSSRPSLKNYSKRKRLENWESQLRMLQEGGTLESRYAAFRGKIGGGLRGMSLGLRGRLTFKRPKRLSGSSVDDAIDDDEDDETLDDISQAAEGVIHMETEEFAAETELLPMLKLKEEMDVVRQTTEETLQENQNIRKDLDSHKTQLGELDQCINTIYHKLELEKERSERLEGQVNDITELHQHEVGELRAQIGQMEGMSMSKSQDLEDAMEACQAKLERMDVFVHRLIDSGDEPTSTIRKPVTTFISWVLMVLTLFIKLFGFIKTKAGLIVTLMILLLAVVLYSLNYR